MRKFLVVGNWKMNGSKVITNDLLQQLKIKLSDGGQQIEAVVCPPSVYLSLAQEVIQGSNIELGAQNIASSPVTSFTGEISPEMLREFGCDYVIIGHSERRTILAESDDLIAHKFKVALAGGLRPILCVGETQEQQGAGLGFAVVASQLQAVIDKLGISAFKDAVIAYEPVWAIGTGLTATPEQAQQMHEQIRHKIAAHDPDIAAAIRIVYGGSVNAGNAASLFKEADIDGGLIGGAALKAQEFSDICHIAMGMTKK